MWWWWPTQWSQHDQIPILTSPMVCPNLFLIAKAVQKFVPWILTSRRTAFESCIESVHGMVYPISQSDICPNFFPYTLLSLKRWSFTKIWTPDIQPFTTHYKSDHVLSGSLPIEHYDYYYYYHYSTSSWHLSYRHPSCQYWSWISDS